MRAAPLLVLALVSLAVPVAEGYAQRGRPDGTRWVRTYDLVPSYYTDLIGSNDRWKSGSSTYEGENHYLCESL